MAETTILALYPDLEGAAGALNSMRAEGGFAAEDLMVLSSVPFPEGVLEVDPSKIRLPLVALVFAFVGIAVGVLVAGGSAADYVLRTGGKPILPAPPIGIIAYEFMMVTALVSTFCAALFEMRLPSWRAKVYDRRISKGMIGIAAHCSTDLFAERAEELLRGSGAADVMRDDREFE